jgi:hypothetical protein
MYAAIALLGIQLLGIVAAVAIIAVRLFAPSSWRDWLSHFHHTFMHLD